MLLTIVVSPLNVGLHASPAARVEDDRPGAVSVIALASRLHVGIGSICWPDCSTFDVGAIHTRFTMRRTRTANVRGSRP